MTNSKRFLNAYNKTDKALHARFGLKPSMSYSDAVRRAAALNSLVRRYESDLIDYGRLRNAIVHNSDTDAAIAEPHDDVTDNFERIAELLSEPGLASAVAHSPTVVAPDTPLRDAVRAMGERDFSVMPVVDGGRIAGVFTNKNVVRFAAKHVGGLDAAFAAATVGDALDGSKTYFEIMPDRPVDEVLLRFEKNRKLRMVILTKDGTCDGNILGVITVGDIAAISKMLDVY